MKKSKSAESLTSFIIYCHVTWRPRIETCFTRLVHWFDKVEILNSSYVPSRCDSVGNSLCVAVMRVAKPICVMSKAQICDLGGNPITTFTSRSMHLERSYVYITVSPCSISLPFSLLLNIQICTRTYISIHPALSRCLLAILLSFHSDRRRLSESVLRYYRFVRA